MSRRRMHLSAALVSVLIVGGCDTPGNEDDFDEQDLRNRQVEALERFGQSAAVRNTIGSYTWIEGLRKMRVRGYGLVVGLGEDGSTNCPERVRKRLSGEIRKKYGLGDSRLGLGGLSPDNMINSQDTAVVQVQGDIGAAALKGSPFDLELRALRGTETTSLERGRLYTCDLRYFREVGSGIVQEGKVIAVGEGPIFINPFSQRADSATPVDLRAGRVIGGGRNQEDRRVRIVLSTPSYARAIRIQNKINDRFGRGSKIATAASPSYVALDIPRRYLGKEGEFLAVIRHLYLSAEPGYDDRMAPELAQELPDLQAPHDSIGLAWEGIGKSVKPTIRNLYDHNLLHVSYYSARTGARLGDRLAVRVLQDHALDPESPYQMEAIRELGDATSLVRATDALRLVASADLDPRARTLAYEGLVEHQDPSLASRSLGGQFVLDHVPSVEGSPLIYAKVTAEPRLVILGEPLCKTPMFYQHARDLLTMNAAAGARRITIIRKSPSGRLSPTVAAPLRLYDLISLLGTKAAENRQGQVVGLGVGYSQIIDVIAGLCDKGVINASFHLERPAAEELLGPQRQVGRPESEL